MTKEIKAKIKSGAELDEDEAFRRGARALEVGCLPSVVAWPTHGVRSDRVTTPTFADG